MSLPPELAYLHRSERCLCGLCGRHTAIEPRYGEILQRDSGDYQPRHARFGPHGGIDAALIPGALYYSPTGWPAGLYRRHPDQFGELIQPREKTGAPHP